MWRRFALWGFLLAGVATVVELNRALEGSADFDVWALAVCAWLGGWYAAELAADL